MPLMQCDPVCSKLPIRQQCLSPISTLPLAPENSVLYPLRWPAPEEGSALSVPGISADSACKDGRDPRTLESSSANRTPSAPIDEPQPPTLQPRQPHITQLILGQHSADGAAQGLSAAPLGHEALEAQALEAAGPRRVRVVRLLL